MADSPFRLDRKQKESKLFFPDTLFILKYLLYTKFFHKFDIVKSRYFAIFIVLQYIDLCFISPDLWQYTDLLEGALNWHSATVLLPLIPLTPSLLLAQYRRMTKCWTISFCLPDAINGYFISLPLSSSQSYKRGLCIVSLQCYSHYTSSTWDLHDVKKIIPFFWSNCVGFQCHVSLLGILRTLAHFEVYYQ